MRYKIAALAFLVATFASCCSKQSCITPPPMSTSEQDSIAIGIAAQLASIPVGGSLNTTFSTIVKNEYDRLTDNDKTLFLFLSAIDCYLKEGQVGQDIAKTMAQIVKDKYSAKVAATPPTQRTGPSEYRSKNQAFLEKFGAK